MNFLNQFQKIGENVFSLLKREEYEYYKFQKLLLETNKSVRQLVFKYSSKSSKYKSLIDSNLIQIDKNKYVSVIFTDGKGSVTYEFFNEKRNEVLTIFTNGQEHIFSIEGIEVIDKKQKQEIYQLLNLSEALLKLQDICQIKKQENHPVSVNKPQLTVNYGNNSIFFDIENREFMEKKINRLKKK